MPKVCKQRSKTTGPSDAVMALGRAFKATAKKYGEADTIAALAAGVAFMCKDDPRLFDVFLVARARVITDGVRK